MTEDTLPPTTLSPGQLAADMLSDRQHRTGRLCACLALIALATIVVFAFWDSQLSEQRDNVARIACINSGGVWVAESTTCGWSR